jgi:hypothetical protein
MNTTRNRFLSLDAMQNKLFLVTGVVRAAARDGGVSAVPGVLVKMDAL